MGPYEYLSAGDMPDIRQLRSSRPKARKEYKCDCCREVIKVGERYSYLVSVNYDNVPPSIEVIRSHILCPWEKMYAEP